MDDEDNVVAEEAKEEGEKEEKSISADLIRGHINTIILRSLYDGDRYGYEIIAEIERKSHGQYSLKQPSLYSALKRLEKEGYVTSYWGGSVGGGRRKYFSLTEEGKAISEQNQSEWEYSRTVIDSLISDKAFDFNNPAPTAVNMRVLRNSTSRVPFREGEGEELDYEPIFDDSADRAEIDEEFSRRNAELEEDRNSLSAEKAALEEERTRFEEEQREKNEAYERDRAWRENELAEREKQLASDRAAIEEEYIRRNAELEDDRNALSAEKAALEAERTRFEEEQRAQAEAHERDCAWRENELAERENRLESDRAELLKLQEELADAQERAEQLSLEQGELAEKQSEIEALGEQLRERESEIAALRSEIEQKQAEIEAQTSSLAADEALLAANKESFAAERAQFEEEVRARNEAFMTERLWRERELGEREAAIGAERAKLEALKSEQMLSLSRDMAVSEANRAAQDADLAERIRRFEETEQERRKALEEEEALRRQALDEETARRREALEAEESERRRMLDDEELSRKQSLELELAAREADHEKEEGARLKELGEKLDARSEDLDSRAESLEIREQEIDRREHALSEERYRFAQQLRERDELLDRERREHAAALEEQRRQILNEQQALFRQREQELIQYNYLRMVSAPPAEQPRNDYGFFAPEPPANNGDYRSVVQGIYANTAYDPAARRIRAKSVEDLDFGDLEGRASRDNIRIATTGGKSAEREAFEEENTVHRGKALFLSAIVVFVLCLAEGIILLALQSRVKLPMFYPFLMWGVGLVLLLVTGLAYANHYGAHSLRRSGRMLMNSIIIYALAVILTLIFALSVDIGIFTDHLRLAAYVLVPVVFFFGIVVFGICYHLLTREKK